MLIVVPDEERVLMCTQPHSIGFDRDDRDAEGKARRIFVPCGNLLKIKIHFTDAGEIDMLSTPRSEFQDENGIRHGACITHKYERMRFGGMTRFTYGPRKVIYFDYVSCRRCFKRWSWKRFRKVDV